MSDFSENVLEELRCVVVAGTQVAWAQALRVIARRVGAEMPQGAIEVTIDRPEEISRDEIKDRDFNALFTEDEVTSGSFIGGQPPERAWTRGSPY